MPEFEVICLANSRKLSGRCVAGLRTDGGGWIRPVSELEHGILTERHYQYVDGTECRPLDVLRIDVARPAPECHQPENWALSQKPWQLVCRPAVSQHRQLLAAHVVAGPSLLGSRFDRIPHATLRAAPAAASLALIEPRNLRWHVGTSLRGKTKVRALFELAGAKYDLTVTDPVWEQKLLSAPTKDELIPHRGRVWLTVSLGEPFSDTCCYKLVATVIELSAGS